MVKAIRIHRTGGPEVMVLEDVALEPPGPGMVTVANRAIGLNFIDTYHRSGTYPLPLPTGIGLEGAGVVEAVGAGVDLAPLDLQALSVRGSLYLTRPTLFTYTATTQELRQSSADLFARVLAGQVRVEIGQRYALEDIQQAHRDLEGRQTTGSTVILP